MTDAEKLAKIEAIFETKTTVDGVTTSTHAQYNLEGALFDLDRMEADSICRETIRRVCKQLADIRKVLRS